jgi:two-component system NtrC family sensor kinase
MKKNGKLLPLTLIGRFRNLSRSILDYAVQNMPRVDFLRETSKLLGNFSKCDLIKIHLQQQIGQTVTCEKITRKGRSFSYEVIPNISDITAQQTGIGCRYVEIIKNTMLRRDMTSEHDHITPLGSYWSGDLHTRALKHRSSKKIPSRTTSFLEKYRSLAIIPFMVGKEQVGCLILLSARKNYFSTHEFDFYENFTQTLGLALISQRSQAALHERVKELTCLYGIAQAVERPEASLKEILQNTVELLPPAWQYPEITKARIILDDHVFSSHENYKSTHKQTANITIGGKKRGFVEVAYTQPKVTLDEGPFLKEERSLINTIANEIAMITERIQTNKERAQLQEQLRHADRLATVGQLAAGVAHEINEPLANILGFAQLISKMKKIPAQVKADIEKITHASLHAREIVKKLLIFTRQMPTRKSPVNINQIVIEGLSLLESRMTKEGITLQRSLADNIPSIIADGSQLIQVLVNLLVNAIQAMEKGGVLTIRTFMKGDTIQLLVQDTGIGMDEKTIQHIFMPFFTTKDISEGTGLGLSVAHGIVTSHGGTIEVSSRPGAGSSFTISFPVNQISPED